MWKLYTSTHYTFRVLLSVKNEASDPCQRVTLHSHATKITFIKKFEVKKARTVKSYVLRYSEMLDMVCILLLLIY
jgi:hypothetical protein